MKKYLLYLLSLLSLLYVRLSSAQTTSYLYQKLNKRLAASAINLIPANPGATPSYWCTWSAQNFAVDSLSLVSSIGLGDHRIFSDNLTQKAVFENPAWEKYFPEEIKKDLFLVFDVGWDIQQGTLQDKSKWIIGSMNVATDKFPLCKGSPSEKLQKLNEICKSKGWKGAGLWIAAQTEMDSRGGKDISPTVIENYYRERARWCKEAGIGYWKVDYGSRGGSDSFRQMLTRVAAEEAPMMLVEHGRGSGPLNDEECPWDTPNFHGKGSYRNWDDGKVVQKAAGILKFSDVLRTYDVTAQLSIPTTIDRVAQIFSEIKKPVAAKGFINCEDEPYIAASLGCAMGIMRNPLFLQVKNNEYNPLHVDKCIDEVKRAVRWQRIAPAFAAGSAYVILDSTVLEDTWLFRKGDSWAAWMIGKKGMQSAPAIVTRGIEKPIVKSKGNPPYILCSKNPAGAITVASLKRLDSEKGFYFPLADVTIKVDTTRYIGIFGEYKSLHLVHNFSNTKFSVYAQDLAGNKAINISDLIKIRKNEISIDGTLLKALGKMEGLPGDLSEPGLLIYLK